MGRPSTITDEALLDAARDVLLERGVGTTTAEIAARAEISESVLFHRFKTKDDLIVAVLERQMEVPPVFETLAARVGKGDIAGHLLAVGEGTFESLKKTLPFLMLARSGLGQLDAMREKMKRPHPTQLKALRLLAGYIEAEVQAGRMRQVDSEILARLLLGGVLQFAMTQLWQQNSGQLPLPFPMYMRGVIDILLNGSATPTR